MKKQNEVIIYTVRGDKLCYQIEDYMKQHHMDWQLIDSSETIEDQDLWDEFERSGMKRFPIIQIRGKMMHYQPVSLEELVRYLEQRRLLQEPEGIIFGNTEYRNKGISDSGVLHPDGEKI